MIATHLATFIVGAAALLVFQQMRIDKIEADHKTAISTLVQEHQGAVLAQRQETEKAQTLITQNYEGALNDARIRETSLRMDAGRARAAADSLRVQARAAASRINLPETPGVSVAQYALAANELLAECSREYQELAGVADGHVSDVKTLSEAWPVISGWPDGRAGN